MDLVTAPQLVQTVSFQIITSHAVPLRLLQCDSYVEDTLFILSQHTCILACAAEQGNEKSNANNKVGKIILFFIHFSFLVDVYKYFIYQYKLFIVSNLHVQELIYISLYSLCPDYNKLNLFLLNMA
ncbi:hypothetical protein DXA36_11940 [Eisenbergiella sp. OF01-20]|nr:hypothetical protein DXA36_11940 [Eisenbergiella sp. OF01-20]